MKPKSFTFKTDDKQEVFAYRWMPGDKAFLRGIVQIIHGKAEHAGRYESFAEALNGAGFGVYANDHKGHGRTAGALEEVGHFADENGWNLVLKDIRKLMGIIIEENRDVPVFLMGHSMGSILARHTAISYSGELQGLILSGDLGKFGFMNSMGRLISRLEMKIRGKKARSTLMEKLSTEAYNSAFKPSRTGFDWLSRDKAAVEKYVNDPWCGAVCTASLFYDLLTGMREAGRQGIIDLTRSDMPILFISGERDPVGNNTRSVLKLINDYKKAGFTDISHIFYEDGRHEMLNETNKEEVYADIIGWLNGGLRPCLKQ